MLSSITDNTHEYFKLIKEDPVRNHIPYENRLGKNKEVLVRLEDDKPGSIVCISLQKNIPITESELFEDLKNDEPTVAIFYTIWTYSPGSAGKLIFDAVDFVQEKYSFLNRFITLSPKTEMARKFHLKNGAYVLSINETTVNYEYKVSPR